MDKDLSPEEKQQVVEEFDRFMKESILQIGNEIREEEGLPPLSMEDMLEGSVKTVCPMDVTSLSEIWFNPFA